MEKNNTQSRTAFLILLVVFAIFCGQYFNNFYVPDSDFFDYRDKAIALRHFENPGLSKRPPLYSAAIGAVSFLTNGRDRELFAALFISFASALICLLLLSKITQRMFGTWAFLLVWFWALHPTTIRMAMKPKGEMLLLAISFWAFWLYLKNNRWAYFISFLGTTVRYEGACAVAGVGGGEFFTQKKKLLHAGLSILSIAFLVIWTFLSSSGSDGGSYVNFYSEGGFSFAYVKTIFVGFLDFVPDKLYLPSLFTILLLMSIGIIYGLKNHRREILYTLFYLLGFIFIHVVWFTQNYDYLVIITWCLILFSFTGIYAVAQKIKPLISNLSKKQVVTLFLFVFILVEITGLIIWNHKSPAFRFNWIAFALFNATIPIFAVLHKKHLSTTLMLLVFTIPAAFGMLRNHSDQFRQIHYAKAEYRKAAEWFEQHAKETDKLVISQPFIGQYYTQLDSSRFYNLSNLASMPDIQPADLSAFLHKQGATHVAWLYDNRVYDYDYAWYQWKLNTRGWKPIAFMQDEKDTTGFKLVERIQAGYRYALIYEIVDPEE